MNTARFEQVVDEYDDARPDYPDQVFLALGEAIGGLSGAQVVEVGAGTGIATRQLIARGARVTAVELGPAMLRRLIERTPGAHAVLARGEALPLVDGCADLVCAAQAWHWVDPSDGAREAARVLRPGGHFAAWWNNDWVEANPWCEAHAARLDELNPGWRTVRRRPDDSWIRALREQGFAISDEPQLVRWTRQIDVARFIRWMASKSYVAAARDREDFLAEVEAQMRELFPAGVVTEHFVTGLWVAERTS